MKKNFRTILSLILVCILTVMLLSLAACGKKDEPAAQEAPAQDVAAPAVDPAADSAPAEELPAEAAPASAVASDGVFTSESKGFSFGYDPSFIAMANPAGNAVVYAGDDVELPFCTVSLISGTSAVDYLKEMAAASVIELEKSLETQAGEPAQIPYGDRDIYYIFYTYSDKDAGGTVECAYYAENLSSGDVVVYNSTALSGAADDVNAILKTAIETFRLA